MNEETLKGQFYLELVSHRADNDIIQTAYNEMQFSSFQFAVLLLIALYNLHLIKRKKNCNKRIHLATENGKFD